MKCTRDQTIALAGVLQSLRLVQTIAYTGEINIDYYKASIRSVISENSPNKNIINNYGQDINCLNLGLNSLIDSFSNVTEDIRNIELTQHIIGIFSLQKKISKHPDIAKKIHNGITMAKNQVDHLPIEDSAISHILAQTYKQYISPLPPKIIVSGESMYLNNSINTDKIRSLLLSAIRSAFLWEQSGGSKWKILFGRKQLVQKAKMLLDSVEVIKE